MGDKGPRNDDDGDTRDGTSLAVVHPGFQLASVDARLARVPLLVRPVVTIALSNPVVEADEPSDDDEGHNPVDDNDDDPTPVAILNEGFSRNPDEDVSTPRTAE